ncbi:MAG TPA: cyclic pyranopterin monophosphate synthase MoaC [Chloroflexota bacterium]|nr:cyclic pyranopterin monophosphate synthase MoaC [Chloroflexota bacterium]
MSLTHLDDEGRARMVDVSDKPVSTREATAEATIRLGPVAAKAVLYGTVKKGDVLAVAQVAGVMGAKATSSLIPLCHPLPISGVSIEFTWNGDDLRVRATVRTAAQTGVEMEALTAVSVAALTVYDMVKAVEQAVRIEGIHLVHKSGGRRGEYRVTSS